MSASALSSIAPFTLSTGGKRDEYWISSGLAGHNYLELAGTKYGRALKLII